MNIFKAYANYLKRKKQIDKITILHCGGFELESKYLFTDKEKTLEYCKKIRDLKGNINNFNHLLR